MAKPSRHRNGAGNRVTVYERVTERVTELLQQGVVPWQKPWHAKVGPPRNGVSGKYYRGLNVFLLSHAGFESPWWFSPKQVNDLGGHIMRGEKVSWIHFFKPWLPKGEPADPLEVETDEVEISTRRRPVLIIRAYRVVNLDQCAGPGVDKFRAKHPPVEGPVNNDNDRDRCMRRDRCRTCRNVRVSGTAATRRFTGSGPIRCTCRDAIHVHVFRGVLFSVVFHELTHSTGHEDRLNRKTLTDGTPFGSPTYSREELVAEMGAAFLCAMAGHRRPDDPELGRLHQRLAEILKSDPKALVIAGAQAQKASDFIMGWAGVEQVEAAAEMAEAAA